jgi:HNH endonuclease/AP2 domain
MRSLPSQEYLCICLSYNKSTGKLRWKRRPSEHFKSNWAWKIWNINYAGREAFTCVNTFGHLTGRLDNKGYLAHRIIWKIVTGEDPKNLVDHKNRKPSDNRWHNLRAATKSQNNVNSLIKQGIHFDKARKRWMAYIKKDGKRFDLGRFPTEALAKKARAAGAQRLFGEFAP